MFEKYFTVSHEFNEKSKALESFKSDLRYYRCNENVVIINREAF